MCRRWSCVEWIWLDEAKSLGGEEDAKIELFGDMNWLLNRAGRGARGDALLAHGPNVNLHRIR